MEQRERQRFGANFGSALSELMPSALDRKLRTSPFLRQGVVALPDLYYTLTTLLLCRRRLGEEYTYIAMFKEKHYQQEGVLLNKKTRLLFAVLELVGRNLFLPLLAKLLKPPDRGFEETASGKSRHRLVQGMCAVGRALR